MSIFKKQEPVASYPAYTIFKREVHNVNGQMVTEITANEILCLKESKHLRCYTPGSVVSYALQYNEDPVAAIMRAMERSEKLHWINQNVGTLSNIKREPDETIEVEYGMLVRFEGYIYEIQADHNGNLKFASPLAGTSHLSEKELAAASEERERNLEC